ncbi:hypothetical protein SKAU_G00274190 [Synaphobranchus kaupii]|uniref:HAT C-terminal dimerisation domain-containing protein n=1 Tax=Synaphobranchus kaupii TaxID=118154 RepID=A0A9Q1F138_SYNKA|nr:hypothetical protein SKAU_G00274190 [Synaphobranchus kaupii]
MAYPEPGYNMPCRKTIMARVEKLYNDCSASTKRELSKTPYVAITTDCWTSMNTLSYITATCHHIDEKWDIKSHVLTTEKMEERHTAENLRTALTTIIAEWVGDSSKVSAVVHDNAANIVKANDGYDWESVNCFAHTLQLAINDGFKAVTSLERIIGAASKIVAHFHHSTPATHCLHAKQEQMTLPKHSLIQCCKTSDARNLELRDEYWRTMEEITPVLKLLEVATTATCGERAVSLSVVHPVVCGLMNQHLRTSEENSISFNTFVNAVRKSLEDRFKPSDRDRAHPALVTSVLDPRHKKLKFVARDIRDAARSHVEDLHQQEKTRTDRSTVPENTEVGKRESAMSFLLGSTYHEDTTERSELETYLMQPAAHFDSDPLLWWKAHEEEYPVLARLARRYLCIPATSVPSERVFSASGLLVSRLRPRLLPEHVNMLVFLNKNLHK